MSDPVEILIDERSRLEKLGATTTILGVLLAVWSRDPLLQIELPLGGARLANLTAGHAITLGFPLLCMMYFWTLGQLFRVQHMRQIVRATLPDRLAETDYLKLSARQERWPLWMSSRIALGVRIGTIVVLPAVASLVLFLSYFDFVPVDTVNKGQCYTESGRFYPSDYLFSVRLWDCQPSYMGLGRRRIKKCDGNAECVNEIMKVKRNLPRLYAPVQSWAYLGLESLILIGAVAALVRGSPLLPGAGDSRGRQLPETRTDRRRRRSGK